MLLRFYRGIGPGTILIVIVSAVLIWLQRFIEPLSHISISGPEPMPLYSLVLGLVGQNALMGTIISFLLMLTIAFYLANFNTRLFFITERTLLPASLYILASGFLMSIQTLNPVFPATLMLIIAIDRVMASYRKTGLAYNFFDASLILSLGSLFYFNIIWFYLVIIIGILLIRTLSLRELLLSLFGLVAPYLVVYAIYYVTGKDLGVFSEMILDNISKTAHRYYWSPILITGLITGTTLFIIALSHLAVIFATKKIKTRKTFSLLIWIMIITVAVYFLVPSASVELIYVVLIPFVYIISHFIVFVRNKKIANIMFAIIFTAILAIQLFGIYF
jgi:hypothetical protein